MYNKPPTKFIGKYCLIDETNAVIFANSNIMSSIHIYVIPVPSEYNIVITETITKEEALSIVNEFIDYITKSLQRNPVCSVDFYSNLSLANKLHKMIQNSIDGDTVENKQIALKAQQEDEERYRLKAQQEEEERRKREAQREEERRKREAQREEERRKREAQREEEIRKYKAQYEKNERELLFTVKMVDTEKNKDVTRRLEREKCKRLKKEEDEKRRIEREKYLNQYGKNDTFLNRINGDLFDYYTPETHSIYIGQCYTDNIKDAYNEYCMYGDYTDYESGICLSENIEPLINCYSQSKWFIDALENISDFDDVDELADLLRSIDPIRYASKNFAKRSAEEIIGGLIY